MSSFGIYSKKCYLKGWYLMVTWILQEFPALCLFPVKLAPCRNQAGFCGLTSVASIRSVMIPFS